MKRLVVTLILFLVGSSLASSLPSRLPASYRSRVLRDSPINSERISEKKCQEYKDLVSVEDRFGSLLLWQDAPTTTNTAKEYKCSPFTGLIVGGTKTGVGEFPHMAAIGWVDFDKVDFRCGGSLISEKFVLTAAHCSSSGGKAPDFVRLGDQNLKKSDDGADPVDVNIKRFISHENYSQQSKENDIALIELKQVVEFVANLIRPACLSQVKNYIGPVVATGWGKIGTNGPSSDELLKVALDVVDNRSCLTILEDYISLTAILPTQVCAGGKHGKDTCGGDSGGPIQVSHPDALCVYDIVGLTSYGAVDCDSTSAAIYTRIEPYIDWIENIVWK